MKQSIRRRMSSQHKVMILVNACVIGQWAIGEMPAWIALMNAGSIGLIVGEWVGRNCEPHGIR